MKIIRRFFAQRAVSTLLVFLALIVIFTFFSPNRVFTGQRNIVALGRLFPDLGIVALGVGVLMIGGEFDLSIAAVVPFSSFIFAQFLLAGSSPVTGFLVAILIGVLLGVLNGWLVVKTKMPSFIVTLATLMFWRGVLFVWSRLMPIGIHTYIDADSRFVRALNGTIGSVPVQLVWFIIFATLLSILLHYQRFGNWIYATGDNRDAARAMGISTDYVKIICFVIVGALAAFSGGLQAVRLGTFAATQGVGFELRAIAACVVGGTSLRGGIGSMGGIVLGALMIPILDNGLILMRVPVFSISAFIGLATILFVLLNSYVERKLL